MSELVGIVFKIREKQRDLEEQIKKFKKILNIKLKKIKWIWKI